MRVRYVRKLKLDITDTDCVGAVRNYLDLLVDLVGYDLVGHEPRDALEPDHGARV